MSISNELQKAHEKSCSELNAIGEISMYISGPMSGYPGLNCDTFELAEECLSKLFPDANILNPANLTHYKDWKKCLVRDIEELFRADINAIVLLPGWAGSRGAEIEVFLAKKLFNAKIFKITWAPMSKDFALTDITDDLEITLHQDHKVMKW